MGSGMPSAWDQTENEELMDLLNTNVRKMLIRLF